MPEEKSEPTQAPDSAPECGEGSHVAGDETPTAPMTFTEAANIFE